MNTGVRGGVSWEKFDNIRRHRRQEEGEGVARWYYVNTRDTEGVRLLTREKLLLQILDLKRVQCKL